MILTGIAINAFAGAVIGFGIFVADDDELRSVTFWSLGTLGLATWNAVGVVAPLALLGILISTKFSRVLDILALGDRPASHLGVRVEPVRLQAIAVVGLLASSAVAATGIIAFVGLLVPHIMRIVLGPLNAQRYPAFLPDGTAHGQLAALAAFYFGPDLDVTLVLLIRGTGPMKLGRQTPALLSWNGGLQRQASLTVQTIETRLRQLEIT